MIIKVDLTYCVHDESLYCGRHYAENLKPRCGACDELIFAGQYTKVRNKIHQDWWWWDFDDYTNAVSIIIFHLIRFIKIVEYIYCKN